MLGRLRRRAAQASFPVTIEQVGAENLPFPNEMFDAAVTSMALCTIPDATAALAEMRRVLKPGGQLRFMEHVRGTDLRGPIFDVIAPVWSYLSGGCQPNRNTETSIESAGFTITSIERGSFGLLPYIQGVAVKSN
jgi:SAM-dependent methyltransferase